MKKAISLAAVIGTILFVMNALALFYGWYNSIRFFDKFMHVLGGIFVCFALIAFISRWRTMVHSRSFFLFLIALVFAIGFLWEGYEYIVQTLTGAQLLTIPDSIGDLVADTVGALIAASTFFFVQASKKRYNTANAD